MIRIGRQIPHFEHVDMHSIRARFSDDRRFRYLLQMKYRDSLFGTGRNRKAAVILKNPSAADQRAADTTIRKVETFIYHHLEDVQELAILNIFALRATDAADLNREFERGEDVIGPDNDRMIRDITAGADYVVVAWGSNSGIEGNLYGERVRKVKQLISRQGAHRVFEVRGKQQTLQPLHGMMWGYGHQLVPYLKLKAEE